MNKLGFLKLVKKLFIDWQISNKINKGGVIGFSTKNSKTKLFKS